MGQPTISIHALLAESDTANRTDPSAILDFYPRSPCGERPSAAHASKASTLNFYPRSPCGERQRPSRKTDRLQPFLSTLSLRRATFGVAVFEHTVVISIHALLAESDHSGGPWQAVYMDFYPRSPCGERRYMSLEDRQVSLFLSTLSLRRATNVFRDFDASRPFLSTLSLRRATRRGAVSVILII